MGPSIARRGTQDGAEDPSYDALADFERDIASRELVLLTSAQQLEAEVQLLLEGHIQETKDAKTAKEQALAERETALVEFEKELQQREELLRSIEVEVGKRRDEAREMLREIEAKDRAAKELEAAASDRAMAMARLTKQLQDRETALQEKEDKLQEATKRQQDAVDAVFEDRQHRLCALKDDYEAQAKAVRQQAEVLQREEERREALEAQLEVRTRDLVTRAAEVEAKCRRAEELERSLSRREAEVADKEQRLRGMDSVLDQHSRQLQELERLKDEVKMASSALQAERKALDDRAAEVERVERASASGMDRVRRREEKVVEEARRHEAVVIEAKEELHRLQDKKDELESFIRALTKEETQARLSAAERKREAERARQDTEAELDNLEKETSEWRRTMAALKEEAAGADRRVRDAEGDVRTIRREASALAAKTAQAGTDLKELVSQLGKMRTQLADEREKALADVRGMESQLEAAKTKVLNEVKARERRGEEELRRKREGIMAEKGRLQRERTVLEEEKRITGEKLKAMREEYEAKRRAADETLKRGTARLEKDRAALDKEAAAFRVEKELFESEKAQHKAALEAEIAAWERKKRQELRGLKEKREEEEMRLRQLETDLARLNKARENEAMSQSEQLSEQLAYQQRLELRLEKVTGDIEAERRRLSAASDQLEKERVEVAQKARSLRQAEEALERERLGMLRGFNDLKEGVSTQANELATLKTTLEREKEELTTLKSVLEDKEQELVGKSRELEKQRVAVQRMKDLFDAASKQVDADKAALAQQDAQLEARRVEVEGIGRKAEEGLANAALMVQEAGAKLAQAVEKEKQVNSLAARFEGLTADFDVERAMLAEQHRRAVEGVRRDAERAEAERGRLRVQSLEAELMQAKARAEGLAKEVDRLERRAAELEKLHAVTKAELDIMRQELEDKVAALEAQDEQRDVTWKHRERKLQMREQEAQIRSVELEAMAQNLRRREAALEQVKIQQQQDHAAEKADIVARLERVERIREGLEREQHKVKEEREALDLAWKEHRAALTDVEEDRAAVEVERVELDATRAQLERDARRQREHEEGLERRAARLETREQQLKKTHEEVFRRSYDEANDLDASRSALQSETRRLSEHQQELERRESLLGEMEEALQRREEALLKRAEDAAREHAQLKRAGLQLEQWRQEVKQGLEEARAEVMASLEATKRAQEDAEELRREVAESATRAANSVRELEAVREQLEEDRQQLRARAKRVERMEKELGLTLRKPLKDDHDHDRHGEADHGRERRRTQESEGTGSYTGGDSWIWDEGFQADAADHVIREPDMTSSSAMGVEPLLPEALNSFDILPPFTHSPPAAAASTPRHRPLQSSKEELYSVELEAERLEAPASLDRPLQDDMVDVRVSREIRLREDKENNTPPQAPLPCPPSPPLTPQQEQPLLPVPPQPAVDAGRVRAAHHASVSDAFAIASTALDETEDFLRLLSGVHITSSSSLEVLLGSVEAREHQRHDRRNGSVLASTMGGAGVHATAPEERGVGEGAPATELATQSVQGASEERDAEDRLIAAPPALVQPRNRAPTACPATEAPNTAYDAATSSEGVVDVQSAPDDIRVPAATTEPESDRASESSHQEPQTPDVMSCHAPQPPAQPLMSKGVSREATTGSVSESQPVGSAVKEAVTTEVEPHSDHHPSLPPDADVTEPTSEAARRQALPQIEGSKVAEVLGSPVVNRSALTEVRHGVVACTRRPTEWRQHEDPDVDTASDFRPSGTMRGIDGGAVGRRSQYISDDALLDHMRVRMAAAVHSLHTSVHQREELLAGAENDSYITYPYSSMASDELQLDQHQIQQERQPASPPALSVSSYSSSVAEKLCVRYLTSDSRDADQGLDAAGEGEKRTTRQEDAARQVEEATSSRDQKCAGYQHDGEGTGGQDRGELVLRLQELSLQLALLMEDDDDGDEDTGADNHDELEILKAEIEKLRRALAATED